MSYIRVCLRQEIKILSLDKHAINCLALAHTQEMRIEETHCKVMVRELKVTLRQERLERSCQSEIQPLNGK
jgi:hypothetical protein